MGVGWRTNTRTGPNALKVVAVHTQPNTLPGLMIQIVRWLCELSALLARAWDPTASGFALFPDLLLFPALRLLPCAFGVAPLSGFVAPADKWCGGGRRRNRLACGPKAHLIHPVSVLVDAAWAFIHPNRQLIRQQPLAVVRVVIPPLQFDAEGLHAL